MTTKRSAPPSAAAVAGWEFTPPRAAKSTSELVAGARERVIAAAAEVSRIPRSALAARGAFADHADVSSALAHLKQRIGELLATGPRIGAEEEREPLTAAAAYREAEIPEQRRAELVSLARVARASEPARKAILDMLQRKDATFHERELQRAFLRTALCIAFGPSGRAARDAIAARIHAPREIAALDGGERSRMNRETDRHPLGAAELRDRSRIDARDHADLLAIAEAAATDEEVRREALLVLSEQLPSGIERRFQVAFVRSRADVFLGAEGVRARQEIVDRIIADARSEAIECIELAAAITASTETDPRGVNENLVPPSRWPSEMQEWIGEACDLAGLEQLVAGAIANARANAPCRRCRGDGGWRSEAGWRSCEPCFGTGSGSEAVIAAARDATRPRDTHEFKQDDFTRPRTFAKSSV